MVGNKMEKRTLVALALVFTFGVMITSPLWIGLAKTHFQKQSAPSKSYQPVQTSAAPATTSTDNSERLFPAELDEYRVPYPSTVKVEWLGIKLE